MYDILRALMEEEQKIILSIRNIKRSLQIRWCEDNNNYFVINEAKSGRRTKWLIEKSRIFLVCTYGCSITSHDGKEFQHQAPA